MFYSSDFQPNNPYTDCLSFGGVGVRVDGTLGNSAKFAEFAAFGGVGVRVYDNSDNSAKFAEFAAFGGVRV